MSASAALEDMIIRKNKVIGPKRILSRPCHTCTQVETRHCASRLHLSRLLPQELDLPFIGLGMLVRCVLDMNVNMG